ncbi:Serine protease family S08A [Phytophthora cinnamomi]|uniref:Serine protease family S08A n=1 Tax=Phytophthora cinnamomi TaxID=4785 RepID=UPI00355AA06C|nr:Serine protease family S08A [Phytophthora cinnamomi]
MAASLSAAEESKLSAELQRAIRSDTEVRVDVMVQLASPAQALQDCADATDMGRTERTSCVAESLQSFAAQTQQPVKDLLARHSELFSGSTFLWISNSVAVQGAQRELLLALARLDAVEKIEMEQVFQTLAGDFK